MAEPLSKSVYQQRMEGAIDLFEFSKQVMRQNLRRRNPEATDDEIDRMLIEWFHTRPISPVERVRALPARRAEEPC